MALMTKDPVEFVVRTVRDHEHNEKQYPKGTLLKVDAATRDWMAANGVIERPAKTSTSDTKGN